MDLNKKFERIQHDIVILEKDLLQDLHHLLKINFSTSNKEIESGKQDKLNLFLSKDYDFGKYNSYLTEMFNDIENLKYSVKKLPEITDTLRVTKKDYENKKASLTNTNYELGIIRENCLAEVKSLTREFEISNNLERELKEKVEEEELRQKRKEAEINKLNLEIQNIKHKSVAQSSLMKKAEIEREAQLTRLKEKLRRLDEEAEDLEGDFADKMSSRDVIIQDLNRKITLVDKEIELLKDMESLRISKASRESDSERFRDYKDLKDQL